MLKSTRNKNQSQLITLVYRTLKSIFKGTKFKYDEISDFYYVKNRVDGSFLFQYNPKIGRLYISSYIIKYITEYLNIHHDNLTNLIKYHIVEHFNFIISTVYIIDVGPMESIKDIELSKIFKKYDLIKDIVILPMYIDDITKVVFESDRPIYDHTKYGNIRKVLYKNFHDIDLSTMQNGTYDLFICTVSCPTGKNFKVRIKNEIKDLVY